jgi:CubicO group peptidase (beta-lactamase class C family)
VAEQYYSKYFDNETWHKLHSCTASFTSALIGIVIREGHIPGINVKMLDYFQDYNSGLSELLAYIVQKAYGMRADSFAMQKLLTPLGIDDFYWPVNKNGYARGGGGMRLKPRDMPKIGYLHIMEGEWENDHILSQDWISESGKNKSFHSIFPTSGMGASSGLRKMVECIRPWGMQGNGS